MYYADEAGWSEVGTNTDGVSFKFGDHGKPAPRNSGAVSGIADIDDKSKLEGAELKFDGPSNVVEVIVKTATF